MQIKPRIFSPIFLNFPFLDHLNLSSRQQARDLTAKFRTELCSAVQESHAGHAHSEETNHLGCRMLRAYETGQLTEKQFQDNMVSIFLAGHENPQLLLTSMMFLLADYPVSNPLVLPPLSRQDPYLRVTSQPLAFVLSYMSV
jgi:cytochrome P450